VLTCKISNLQDVGLSLYKTHSRPLQNTRMSSISLSGFSKERLIRCALSDALKKGMAIELETTSVTFSPLSAASHHPCEL